MRDEQTSIVGSCRDDVCSIPSTGVNVYDCGPGFFCTEGACLVKCLGGICALDVNSAGCDIAPGAAVGPGRWAQYKFAAPGNAVQNYAGMITFVPFTHCAPLATSMSLPRKAEFVSNPFTATEGRK